MGTVSVDAVRLDSQFDQIDFLKVEAEGAEPEVLEGASGCNIDKVVVDASPERVGNSTLETVHELLQEQGYEVVIDGDMVFGVS